MLSPNTAMELISHEGIVREAYKDSVGVWTWGVGVTNMSGHEVYPRYKDNPQELKRVLEVYEWLLRTRYLPDVHEAFDGYKLKEHEEAAALSFHYNTGAIKRATWVEDVLNGHLQKGYENIMNWRSPPEIIPRRKKERDLFFLGHWSHNWTTNVYPVSKPRYTPNFSQGERVNLKRDLKKLFG